MCGTRSALLHTTAIWKRVVLRNPRNSAGSATATMGVVWYQDLHDYKRIVHPGVANFPHAYWYGAKDLHFSAFHVYVTTDDGYSKRNEKI